MCNLYFSIKLADQIPSEDAIQSYFLKVSDYFIMATNDHCSIDFEQQKIRVDASFFPFFRTGIGKRYPEKTEQFPFGLRLAVKKENRLQIKLSFQLVPTLIFYLLSSCCAILLLLFKSNGIINNESLSAILFFFCTISLLTFLMTYAKARSVINLLHKLYKI